MGDDTFMSSKLTTEVGVGASSLTTFTDEGGASDPTCPGYRASATTQLSVDNSIKPKRRNVLGIIEENLGWGISIDDVDSDLDGVHKRVTGLQEQNIGKVMKLLKAAQSLFLAFVVDTSGSMDAHIAGVKNQINTIVNTLANQQVRASVAFVGYKDHCDGAKHFEILPFTRDTSAFQRFVNGVVATGGGDQAEDALGGLVQALTQLQWDCNTTNLIFHIADAPPHGQQYQDARGVLDEYPHGHPSDPKPQSLFERMGNRDIQYFFGKINNSTDAMVETFAKYLASPPTTFNVRDPINIADSAIIASTLSISKKREKSMSVMKSGRGIGRPGSLGGGRMVGEEKPLIYSTLKPTWESVPKCSGTLVAYELPKSVNHIISGDFKTSKRKATFKIALKPFAHGAERAAYYALEYHKMSVGEASSATYATENMVLKEYLRYGSGSEGEGNRFMNAMETQTVAAFFAQNFNRLTKDIIGSGGLQLKFLKAKVLRIGKSAPYTFYSVEKRYREYGAARFVKLSNNAGHVTTVDQKYVEYAMAFSHWALHCTMGFLMVVDLQGQRLDGDNLLLTDPAIHSLDKVRFNSGTNLGERGFDEFFRTHKCNTFCRAIGLNSSKTEQEALWDAAMRSSSATLKSSAPRTQASDTKSSFSTASSFRTRS